jgi:UDP-GlcNAc:undecaprenyl-phosphate GlcNAc-1-phosphate transferase
VPTSVFIVLAGANATNLLDGLDGLCSGVTGVISLCFLAMATHLAMYASEPKLLPVIAPLAMAGAVCGFLPYNSSPATIFMGDAGSMLLGLYAAAMMLLFGQGANPKWVVGAVMIFGLPILDTSLALLRRVRLHRPIFAGDRSHLYDQLVDRGYSVRQTVGICYGLAAFYGVMGLTIMFIRIRYALVLYPAVAVVTLYLCHRWGFLNPPEETPREQTETASAASDSPEEQV